MILLLLLFSFLDSTLRQDCHVIYVYVYQNQNLAVFPSILCFPLLPVAFLDTRLLSFHPVVMYILFVMF